MSEHTHGKPLGNMTFATDANEPSPTEKRMATIRRMADQGQGIYPGDVKFLLNEIDRRDHAIREHIPACYVAMIDPGAREALRKVVEEAADYRES